MREVRLTLDFACCHCGGPVSVTVECSGKGLDGPERLVAAVSIPCPDCQRIIQLSLRPRRHRPRGRAVPGAAAPMPAPSAN